MDVLACVSLDDFKTLVASNDFDCLPRSYQVKEFARFLMAQKVSGFTATDLSGMFVAAGMISPRSNKPIRCSPAKVAEYIRKFIEDGQLPLRDASPNEYQV